MAGYVLKIVVENTHPPVWRRIIIPEKITFEELHRIIQIVFGWTGEHLHDFCIPSEYIYIDNNPERWSAYHYMEDETLVEQFLLEYKWVRYTYDFGDEWRHKIIYEKTDENYEERYATLLKVKGDNFQEDSGRIWESEESGWNRYALDKAAAEKQLKKLLFPIHDDLNKTMAPKLSDIEMEKLAEELLTDFFENLYSHFEKRSDGSSLSRVAVKVEKWEQFLDDSSQKKTTKNSDYSQMVLPFLQEEDLDEPDYILEIVLGMKTCAELLDDLSPKETEDYCKYLQIPMQDTWSKGHMAKAIAQEFYRHPEYLLYVLKEDEYKEFLALMELPYGRCEIPQQDNMLTKVFELGLADIAIEKRKGKTKAKLSFAKDAQSIVGSLQADVIKHTYRELKRFSDKLKDIILVYGIVDFDSLFEMFRKIYHETMKQEDLCRYIYWHARFNNLVQTAYSLDGTRYVAALQLDMMAVLEKMQRYSDDLEYVLFSKKELHQMAYNIGGRNEWIDILFATFVDVWQFPESIASHIIEELYSEIMNGNSLPAVLNSVKEILLHEINLIGICALWETVAGFMLEEELPMLKGRTRIRYAEEKNISPWEIEMIDGQEVCSNSKERHMYEFPAEIQEAMYQACIYVNEQAMDMLWQYKTKEKIQSEEYIFLLAKAHTINSQYKRAENLIQSLRKSSARGKEAAQILQKMLDEGMDVMDDGEEWLMDFPETVPWMVPQPYVRETPKIGRNDPCPCGSGKKYKKCCGKINNGQ